MLGRSYLAPCKEPGVLYDDEDVEFTEVSRRGVATPNSLPTLDLDGKNWEGQG